MTLSPPLHLTLIASVFKLDLMVYIPIREELRIDQTKITTGKQKQNTLHLLCYSPSTAVILKPQQTKSRLTMLFHLATNRVQPSVEIQKPEQQAQRSSYTDILNRAGDQETKRNFAKIINRKQIAEEMDLNLRQQAQIQICSFCNSKYRAGVSVPCGHKFCVRCYRGNPNTISRMINESDCLIPQCPGKLEAQKGKSPLQGKGCSMCGRLTLQNDLVLDFVGCDHSLCRWCVTAHFQLHPNKDRCPFPNCTGSINVGDHNRKELKKAILSQNLCMNEKCRGYVSVRANPKCNKTCPVNYCDSCLDNSFIKHGEFANCKGCGVDVSWLEQVNQTQKEPICSKCSKNILGMSVEFSSCKHLMHFSCRNKVIAKAISDKLALAKCPHQKCATKVSIKT